MKSLVYLDGESVRGKRQLGKAFLNGKAKELMVGYDFNPKGIFPKVLKECFRLNDAGCLRLSDFKIIDTVSFPDGSDRLGIRLHHLDFEFTDGTSTLCSSEWLFLKNDTAVDHLSLSCGVLEKPIGTRFSILEIQFYVSDEGGFVPLIDDGTKIVHVLQVV